MNWQTGAVVNCSVNYRTVDDRLSRMQSAVRFATTEEQSVLTLAYEKCGTGILGEAKTV